MNWQSVGHSDVTWSIQMILKMCQLLSKFGYFVGSKCTFVSDNISHIPVLISTKPSTVLAFFNKVTVPQRSFMHRIISSVNYWRNLNIWRFLNSLLMAIKHYLCPCAHIHVIFMNFDACLAKIVYHILEFITYTF